MKKTKYQRERKKYFFKKNLLFPILLSFSCLFLCIGYASINDIDLNINGIANAEAQNGLFISNVKILEEDGQMESGTIISYKKMMMNTNIVLEQQEGSSITFEIELYNNSTALYVFSGVTPNEYDEDFFPNKYMTYELDSRLQKDDRIDGYQTHIFSITFKYIDGLDFNNLPEDFSNVLNSYINFDFENYMEEFSLGGHEFVVDVSGYYQLETWGAQGGDAGTKIGGYGAYATGVAYLEEGTKLFVHVGGAGSTSNSNNEPVEGGYNGGGDALSRGGNYIMASGGGATHIATGDTDRGELYNYVNNKDEILIVAGGGGGSGNGRKIGGSGGGFEGVEYATAGATSTPATQTSGGTGRGGNGGFGQGGGSLTSYSCGGGGGYYGGGGDSFEHGGGGGSGFIGNPLLTEKSMYCYDCDFNDEENTKTIATANYSDVATSNYVKTGDGYAKVTLLNYVNLEIYLDGYSTTSESDQTLLLNGADIYEIKTPSKFNYKFKGWKVISGNATIDGTSINMHNKDAIIEAIWEENPNQIIFEHINAGSQFTVPKTGYYKLETWGAQGGNSGTSSGGFGAYATGTVYLEEGTTLYVHVGGAGTTSLSTVEYANGGYNGGGHSLARNNTTHLYGSGGGATHISLVDGVLSSLTDYETDCVNLSSTCPILIVAGGGGGSGGSKKYSNSYISSLGGGAGGGFESGFYNGNDTNTTPATQTSGGNGRGGNGSFGQGGGSRTSASCGAGGGFYGGGADSFEHGAGGGSGFIGNPLLTEKSMYCYNCTESTETDTYTVNIVNTDVTHVSETAISQYAKQGNGSAKITYIEEN